MIDNPELPFPAFLRRQALEAGVTDDALLRARRAGRLVRPRQGLYVDAGWWEGAPPVERHRETARALAPLYGGPFAFSHVTAAILHGLPVWDIDLSLTHLTHLAPSSGRRMADVAHHRADPGRVPVAVVDGLPVTSAARTIIDIVRTAGVERAMVVADAALRAGLATPHELAVQCRVQERDPHTLLARKVVAMADGRSGSPGETRARLMFQRAGIPRPVLQFEVRDRRGLLLGFTDFAWPELGVIIEFDGRTKYEAFLRPGESVADAVLREKEREDAIREATGWIVIRLTWADLRRPELVAQRFWRAVRIAAQRAG